MEKVRGADDQSFRQDIGNLRVPAAGSGTRNKGTDTSALEDSLRLHQSLRCAQFFSECWWLIGVGVDILAVVRIQRFF